MTTDLEARAARIIKQLEKASEQRELGQIAETQTETVQAQEQNAIDDIMSAPGLTNQEKIDKITDFLTAKDNNFDEARLHFVEFEAYFARLQAKGMQADVQAMDRLIAELRDSLKPEVEKIVGDIHAINNGVDQAKKLMEVLRSARLSGTTIDEIGKAIRQNDKAQQEIEAHTSKINFWESEKTRVGNNLQSTLDAEAMEKNGFLGALKHRILGTDRETLQRIQRLQKSLEESEREITEYTRQRAEIELLRKAEYDDGAFTILRSIDAAQATDEGFSRTLVGIAESGISCIENATSSVERLLRRAGYSEKEAAQIGSVIGAAQIRETILKAAVSRVTETTRGQSEGLFENLQELDAKQKQAEEGSAEHALTGVEKIEMGQKHSASLAYADLLLKAGTTFEMISANSREASAQAMMLTGVIGAEKDMLKRLAIEALPATARALHLMLQQNVAQQTGELAHSVAAVTHKAKAISDDSMKGLRATQNDLFANEMGQIDLTLNALNTAQTTMVEMLEGNVEQHLQRNDAMGRVQKAAIGLNGVLADLERVGSLVSKRPGEKAAPVQAAQNNNG